MQSEPTLTPALLVSFLLVLTRVTLAFVFVPFPGSRSMPDVPKIAASLCLTLALYPAWPSAAESTLAAPGLLAALLGEAGLGILIGVVVGLIAEGFLLAAQMIGLQAGYSFASTIDPTTQSDSTVLQSLVQLMTGLLFFSTGLHHHVIAIFVRSLERWPPGSFFATESTFAALQRFAGTVFTTGLRLVLPVIALLLLLDISLALLGRINAHLQLLSLAFPVKMLGAIAILASTVAVFPLVYERTAHDALALISKLLG